MNSMICRMRFIFLAFYIILGTFSSFAQREGTIRNKETAKSDSLAAWYEKTLQLGCITVTGRAADKKVTVEKTSINPSASVSSATGSVLVYQLFTC